MDTLRESLVKLERDIEDAEHKLRVLKRQHILVEAVLKVGHCSVPMPNGEIFTERFSDRIYSIEGYGQNNVFTRCYDLASSSLGSSPLRSGALPSDY
jgi:hypothetical protein